jgi:hypothetical protein
MCKQEAYLQLGSYSPRIEVRSDRDESTRTSQIADIAQWLVFGLAKAEMPVRIWLSAHKLFRSVMVNIQEFDSCDKGSSPFGTSIKEGCMKGKWPVC